MEPDIETAAKRAVATMIDNLGEPLTVGDLARSAMFSKFHFARIFQRVTGVSPGRFLSALRLRHAQQLLVSTSLNVADISQRVGYQSVGTFSARFTRSVGMSPTAYRQRSGFASRIVSGPDDHPAITGGRVFCRFAAEHHETGQHHERADEPRLVFAGLFPERIPQGRPVRCAVLTQPAPFTLDNVPPGTWHLLAQSVPGALDDPDGYRATVNESVRVASYGPITVRPQSVIQAELRLKSVEVLDPPVLLALLDVRKLAMGITGRDAGRETGRVAV